VWQQVLRLYLAWEAAESGEPQLVRELLPKSALLFLPGVTSFADALLTRTAVALARSEHDSHHWLAEFGRAADAAALLDAYAVAVELPPDAVLPVMAEAEPLITRLEQATDEGAAEAASAITFVDEQPEALMDPETAAGVASSLEQGLRRIAANEQGQVLLVRALRPISATRTRATATSRSAHWARRCLPHRSASGYAGECKRFCGPGSTTRESPSRSTCR
jgi:hypothetical protein